MHKYTLMHDELEEKELNGQVLIKENKEDNSWSLGNHELKMKLHEDGDITVELNHLNTKEREKLFKTLDAVLHDKDEMSNNLYDENLELKMKIDALYEELYTLKSIK